MSPSLANETLKFQLGEVYRIAIQQSQGKVVTSRFSGDQLLFSLLPTDDAPWLRMFVEPYVQEKIAAAHIAPGDQFEISKRETFHGNKRVVSMEVRALGASDVPTPAPGVRRVAPDEPPHNRTPAPRAPQPPPLPPILPPAPVNGAGENSAAILARCYRDAVDIALDAVSYAETKGLRVTPTFEDIRCISATLCITQTGRR